MRAFILVIVIFLSGVVNAKTLTVAVIDTGLRKDVFDGGYANGICKMGHKDFTGEGLDDVHGHGTNISGLIHRNAKGYNYCQVIIKVYAYKKFDAAKCAKYKAIELIPKDDKCEFEHNHLAYMIAAINYAINIKVNIINISGGGLDPSADERLAIEKALNAGIRVIASAGNEASDLEELPFYPAAYDARIVVVGNGESAQKKSDSSNFGKKVTKWVDGKDKSVYGIKMTGTSQSTAIVTGETVRDIYVQSWRQAKSQPRFSESTVRTVQEYTSLSENGGRSERVSLRSRGRN